MAISRSPRVQHWIPLLLLLTLVLALTSRASAAVAGAPPDSWRLSPDLGELLRLGEHGRTYKIMLVIFQVATMLTAAKLLGWLAERIRVPGVIGELLAGALIGPYLLGNVIRLPIHGHWIPLFPSPSQPGEWPVNDVIWSMATFASIVLLFITGLHTDLKQFLKYLGPASLVAVVGIVAPFLLGVGLLYIPFFADIARPAGGSVLVPALFVGAILAATSIGITARVLQDIGQLDSPEGVTILGAAVLDDVLGIIALAIVGGIASAGSISVSQVGVIAGKAFGFWIALTVMVFILARPIEWFFLRIRYAGAVTGLGLALAFACSGAAESFGLAFIIGAYSVGLGLSRSDLTHRLMEELRPIGDFTVPIFFAALGMLVNFQAMFSDWRIVVFGLAVTAVAVIGKLVGCGMAALPVGFNARGAYRIGLGMMPRGEVALIVAGIGLSRGLIQEDLFAVSIMMTLLTTIAAPILLVPAFAGGSGRKYPQRGGEALPTPASLPRLAFHTAPDLAKVLLERLVNIAEQRGWARAYEAAEDNTYLLRNRGDAAQLSLRNSTLQTDTSDQRQGEFAEFLQQARDSMMEDLKAEAGLLQSSNETSNPVREY